MRDQITRRSAEAKFDVTGDGSGGGVLRGHAAVFRVETTVAGLFREQILPRAFAKTLADGADVRALIDHTPNLILGRTRAGTLRLHEDDVGLAFEVDLPDTSTARDIRELVARGDVSGASFAFRVVREQRQEPDSAAGETLPLFSVQECKLYDVSVCTYPAYPETDVSANSDSASLDAAVARFADYCGRSTDEVLAYMRTHPGETDLKSLWSRAIAASVARVRDVLTIS